MRENYSPCPSCDGGNVFGFVMRQQNMTFPEAVRYLAGRGGVAIPENLPPVQRCVRAAGG